MTSTWAWNVRSQIGPPFSLVPWCGKVREACLFWSWAPADDRITKSWTHSKLMQLVHKTHIYIYIYTYIIFRLQDHFFLFHAFFFCRLTCPISCQTPMQNMLKRYLEVVLVNLLWAIYLFYHGMFIAYHTMEISGIRIIITQYISYVFFIMGCLWSFSTDYRLKNDWSDCSEMVGGFCKMSLWGCPEIDRNRV